MLYSPLIYLYTRLSHTLTLSLAGYVEGTFTLVWRKQGGEGAGEVEEDLFENSTATLYESGMEGEKRVYLLLRDKDGKQPEKVEVSGLGHVLLPLVRKRVRVERGVPVRLKGGSP